MMAISKLSILNLLKSIFYSQMMQILFQIDLIFKHSSIHLFLMVLDIFS